MAAVSQCLMSTGTAPPDGGKSTTVPDGSGTASSTLGPALVVRGMSPGASRPDRGARVNPVLNIQNSTEKGLSSSCLEDGTSELHSRALSCKATIEIVGPAAAG